MFQLSSAIICCGIFICELCEISPNLSAHPPTHSSIRTSHRSITAHRHRKGAPRVHKPHSAEQQVHTFTKRIALLLLVTDELALRIQLLRAALASVPWPGPLTNSTHPNTTCTPAQHPFHVAELLQACPSWPRNRPKSFTIYRS